MKKKLKIIQVILVASFLLFLFFILKPKTYTREYDVNNVTIKESYNKKGYYFEFNYKDTSLDFFVSHKFQLHRGFIKEIKIVEDQDNFCIIPTSKSLSFIPLCKENGQVMHYTLVGDSLKKQIPEEYFFEAKEEATYEDITIYNQDYTYLVWNYDGFYYMNKDIKKKISLFKKESYNISLIGYTKDYLVIADYDSSYTFNKIYTIAFKNDEVKEFKLNRDIYFDSYFIGYEKNKLYIVDNKENIMYELNAKNGKIEKTKSKVLVNGLWEEKSIKALVNKKQSFSYKTDYEYSVEDSNLYLNYKEKNIKTLIASNITSIVRTNSEEIFYLKEDVLYRFTPNCGEEKLLTYFEWNFNYENMIYIN